MNKRVYGSGWINAMVNIVLTRIDERFIHGQVATQWASTVQANLILVANDAISLDPLRQELMSLSAPSFCQTRFFSLEKTAAIIHKAADHQRIMILCESPQDVLSLVQAGVPIRDVNVGNMHMAAHKEQVSKAVYVNAEDRQAFQALKALNVTVEIKRVPAEPVEASDGLWR